MSLELSKEMLAVKGYLSDARVLVEGVHLEMGRSTFAGVTSSPILEVARMLQIEQHQNKHHKKSKPESTTPVVPQKQVSSDSLMTRARKNPKLPPMVTADEDAPVVEFTTSRTKTLKRLRASDVPRGVDPDELAKPRKRSTRTRKADPKPKRVTPKKSAKPRRR